MADALRHLNSTRSILKGKGCVKGISEFFFILLTHFLSEPYVTTLTHPGFTGHGLPRQGLKDQAPP